MADLPRLSSLQSEAPGDLAPGTRLGKYELIRRLSVGGMAEIFLARARGLPGFQLHVAIKRILPQLAAHHEFVEMFLDEARIAATLQHPHIVQIYDVCVVSESYFIAMEYLHGEDVHSILRACFDAGRRVPIEHILQIMIAILSGLHYAHEKKSDDGEERPLHVVHCDVSPGNVLVTFEGGIKLVDFGIATAALRSGEARTGQVQGKLGYMSPEQAQGIACDRRTDVYAAGVMLYELCTGRKLYKAGTDLEVLSRVVHGDFKMPREVDPSIDPLLEQIIMRALATDRDKRFPTAQAMQIELEEFAAARGLYMSAPALKRFMAELFNKQLSELEKTRRPATTGEYGRVANTPGMYANTPPPVEAVPRTPTKTPRRLAPWGLLATGIIGVVALGSIQLRPSQHAPAPPSPVAAAVVPAPPPAPPAPELTFEPEPPPDADEATEATKSKRGSKRGSIATTTPKKHSSKSAAPQAGFGALTLSVTPWVAVSIDGRSRGQTPMTISLPAGQHTILLTNPEHSIKRSLTVEIKAGQNVRKKLDFSEYE